LILRLCLFWLKLNKTIEKLARKLKHNKFAAG